MGAWGAGLYSSDIAADMRAVIKSVLRLPFDEEGARCGKPLWRVWRRSNLNARS